MTLIKLSQVHQVNKSLDKELPVFLQLFRDKYGGEPERIALSSRSDYEANKVEGIPVTRERDIATGHVYLVLSDKMRKKRHPGV